jgi:hypothetical protein
MTCLAFLTLLVFSVVTAQGIEYVFDMNSFGCEAKTPRTDGTYVCIPNAGWEASATSSGYFVGVDEFRYTFKFSETRYISSIFGIDAKNLSGQGFPASPFNIDLYSTTSPFADVASFPLVYVDTNFRCNASMMFGQEPCTGHCTSVNNACNVGKYSFTYHPTDDTMTIQYAGYNSITVSAIVASGNNHEDTYYGTNYLYIKRTSSVP